MTVRELLEHFNIYPDKICFYDEQNNIQDTVKITHIESSEKVCNRDVYRAFMNEYGDRDVIDWNYGYDNMLEIAV